MIDEGDMRHLRFDDVNNASQSTISLRDPKLVPMEYIRLASIGLAYLENPGHVLMIGLGGGTFTTLLWQVLSKVQIDAVVDCDYSNKSHFFHHCSYAIVVQKTH